MNRYRLEICTGDLASVATAVKAGADRVELCAALEVGGITPSPGIIEKAVAMRGNTGIHVLIRPREGDFIYTPEEALAMIDDIRFCHQAGVQGVVIGALLPDGSIDTDLCYRLVKEAGDMSVTFHRAFDLCRNSEMALEEIIALGCERILTSGQAPTAFEGVGNLRKLQEQASGRMIILAGSGVSPENAEEIIRLSGVRELHASARSTVTSPMTFRRPDVAMGAEGADEFCRKVADFEKIKKLKRIIDNYKTK